MSSERVLLIIDCKPDGTPPLPTTTLTPPIRLRIINANSRYEDIQHTTEVYLRNYEFLGNTNPLPLVLIQLRVPVEDNYVVISQSQTAGSTPQFFWGPFISATIAATNFPRLICRASPGRDFPLNNAEILLWQVDPGSGQLLPFTDYTTCLIELTATVNGQFK